MAWAFPPLFFRKVMENVIRSIDPGSPLERRAAPGDRLVSINGHPILDVLDYKF